MLISKTVKMKWNSKNKSFYESKGYIYTKMKDEFDVRVEDLKAGSNVMIEVKCDYCNCVYKTKYYIWLKLKEKANNKDCCHNPQCTGQKSKESLEQKYGDNIDEFFYNRTKKAKQTNLEKYGCENPFQNEEIKNKIKETNIEKYGVPVPTQNPDIRRKGIETCIKKYGVPSYGVIYSAEHKGELSPVWKGENRKTERVERFDPQYRDWRKEVFIRDGYTCQCCGIKSGKGKSVCLEAHHKNNFKDFVEERFLVSNGVTLCKDCHKKFHSMFGKKNNTEEQFKKFINHNKHEDKKIC